MKVLHVISSVSPFRGGPSRAIADMERALAARGIQVTTITTNDDGGAHKLTVACGEPITTPYATRWYFPRELDFYNVSIGLGRWLTKNIEAFDVVHVHALFSFAPTVAAFLARRRRVPYILRPLGVLARYGITQRRPHLKKLSIALLERRLIESASAIHFTSIAEQSEAEMLRLKCNSVVIPLGVDTDSLGKLATNDRLNRGGPFKLLFLSRIDPKKNLESLLHALSFVASKHPTVILDIAGGGDPGYVNGLKELARRLGIADNVNWLGHVEGDEKARLLATATAFVLPSYSENFGIAVAEALAAGLPCIVSDGVALSHEITMAQAGIVTGTDTASIAWGIQQLLNDKTAYYAMSKAARSLAANAFSMAVMGERLEMLYRSIVVSHRSAGLA
jgi:glycosyltransferase involved in cell wall biosynthesis